MVPLRRRSFPQLLEFMQFQQNEEAQLTLASFMVRIRDRIPEGEFAIAALTGEDSWGWWGGVAGVASRSYGPRRL